MTINGQVFIVNNLVIQQSRLKVTRQLASFRHNLTNISHWSLILPANAKWLIS